ncbi:MAG: TldD/PmbA family protein [Euryarchaeota archaeon]|nr:TldD/PmbA family protein [Euryarchaeota archaeon]
MKRDGILDVAEEAVRRAKAAGAPSCEAFVLRDASGGVRVERNDLGGVETETSFGIGLRVLHGGRLGFAYVTGLDGVKDGVRSALGSARISKKTPGFAFAGPGKVPRIAGLFDQRLAALEAPEAIDFALDLVRSARDVNAKLNVTEAGVSFGVSESAVANSEGVALEHRETMFHASCFVVQDEAGVSTGFASADSNRRDLDPLRLGKKAARLALDARNPKPLAKGGRLPIVLRPEPASDLVDTVTLAALHGKDARRGESFYSGKKGKAVAHPKVSVIDDPTLPRGLGSAPFDDEGEPSRHFVPIAKGVLKGYVFDRSTASEFKERTTASAIRMSGLDGRSYKAPPTASSRNVRIEAPSRTTERLIAGVDDGLLVHDLMGVHTANVVSGDFSVTSSLLFRIRKGAVEGPVAPLSVAGNFHRVLRAGITLGDDVKAMAGETAIAMPSLRTDELTVTP